MEDALGDIKAVGAAVAFNLALVGSQLGVIREAAIERVGGDRLDWFRQRLRIAVETNADVEPRIGEADEEPSIGGTRAEQVSGQWPD